MTDEDIQNCIDATDWCRADYEYFRGGGFSSHFRTKAEMPVTMLRVNIVEGIGPVIQIAEGYTCNLDVIFMINLINVQILHGRQHGLLRFLQVRAHLLMYTV